MIKRTLKEITAMCGGELISKGVADTLVQGVVTDSRKLSAGCLFVPLAGENFDGHEFAEHTFSEGAAAVLWQKDHGTPPVSSGPVILVDDTLNALQRLSSAYLKETGARVVGITGSNGKTTTKDIVFALLSTAFKVHKTQGNFNNHIGLPLTILSMPEDTQIAVLEMGMSARGEIALLSKIAEPETAVITNIGESHLQQLGSREEIARAKTEIVAGMKPGGLLIYNGDEPLIPMALSEDTTIKPQGMNTFTFGLKTSNDDYPVGLEGKETGMLFSTSRFGSQEVFHLPLLGRHNAANALAAIAVAVHYGVNPDQIRKGLEEVRLTGMRIEVVSAANGVTILNDAYNASPTSMKAALEVLNSMQGCNRKIAVLGDMLELGGQTEDYHREIGAFLTGPKADILFAYGTLGGLIAAGAAGILPQENIHAYTDKEQLIEDLTAILAPNDVVLVKASRGMRLEEVVHKITEHTFKQS